MQPKKIKSALISVYHKDHLEPVISELQKLGVELYSTGDTKEYIQKLGVEVNAVEDLTSYPSILGGRVKTLHPKVFGGILGRREDETDIQQLEEYEIPEFDLVIVDLYPFEETVQKQAAEQDIIEKIDIGGISLIRAAAKNFRDVLVVPSVDYYDNLLELLHDKNGISELEDRRSMARMAFEVSSHYDAAIYNWFCGTNQPMVFKTSVPGCRKLRYGENPHQDAVFYGKLDDAFEQLHGKALSYNNLVDVDSAVRLMEDFKDDEPTFAIIKHTNTCGLATRSTTALAFNAALACDPVSAFGSILITNRPIEHDTAAEIDGLFCEVVIAPEFSQRALLLLKQKKNRRLLVQKDFELPDQLFRNLLNGAIVQERDKVIVDSTDYKTVTEKRPDENQIEDMVFGMKAVKHLKSNAIALVKDKQLIGIGTGQTSRVDALNQAMTRAHSFGFDPKGAVVASDAFFPFADSVEIAHLEGVKAVIQPGGSRRDQDSIDYCNENGLSMVFTGIRHFKH